MPDHWDDALDPRPIRLSDGRELVTLRDAGEYIATLPKHVSDRRAWRIAVRELLRAAAGHGPWRFIARVAILHALADGPVRNDRERPHKARK